MSENLPVGKGVQLNVVNNDNRGFAAGTITADTMDVYTRPGSTTVNINANKCQDGAAQDENKGNKGTHEKPHEHQAASPGTKGITVDGNLKTVNKGTEGVATGVAVFPSSEEPAFLNIEQNLEVENEGTKGIASGIVVAKSASVVVTEDVTKVQYN